MPTFKFRCPACEHEDTVERPLPPKHCPECGSPVKDVKEIPPIRLEKTPPEVPPELEEVRRDHEAGHACKYGCVPPSEEKCAKCPDEKCTERAAKYKYHWKRRKVVKIVKSLLGKDIVEVVTDKGVWKDVAKSRAKKLIDALGIEGDEAEEMLKDLDDFIDKSHGKLKHKLK